MLANIGIFDIIIYKLIYWQGLYLIILFKSNKKLKIHINYNILLFHFFVYIRLKNIKKTLLKTKKNDKKIIKILK